LGISAGRIVGHSVLIVTAGFFQLLPQTFILLLEGLHALTQLLGLLSVTASLSVLVGTGIARCRRNALVEVRTIRGDLVPLREAARPRSVRLVLVRAVLTRLADAFLGVLAVLDDLTLRLPLHAGSVIADPRVGIARPTPGRSAVGRTTIAGTGVSMTVTRAMVGAHAAVSVVTSIAVAAIAAAAATAVIRATVVTAMAGICQFGCHHQSGQRRGSGECCEAVSPQPVACRSHVISSGSGSASATDRC